MREQSQDEEFAARDRSCGGCQGATEIGLPESENRGDESRERIMEVAPVGEK